MKYLMFALLVTASFANAATTKGNYFACETRQSMEEVADLLAANNAARAQAYVAQGKCTVLGAGLTVSVTGRALSLVEFVFAGKTFWASREAIQE